MAWTTIDDAAWGSTNDGSVNSAQAVKLRDNAAYVSDENLPSTGIAFPVDEPLRIGSVYPKALGPIMLFVPPQWDWDTATLYCRTSGVAYDGESDGTTAGYVYAVAGSFEGGYIDPPPTDPQTWGSASNGATLTKTSAAANLVLTGIPLNGQKGWVPIFLWYVSRWGTSAGATAEGTIDNELGGNGFELTITVGSAPTNVPTRRAFVLQNWVNSKDPPPNSQVYNLEVWIDDATIVGAELSPQLPQLTGAYSRFEIYSFGMLRLTGITATLDPPTFPVQAAAVHSQKPVAEQWLALATEINALVHHRTRQWLCAPIGERLDGTRSALWPVYGKHVDLPGRLTTTYQALARTLVSEEPDDDAGYRAAVALVVMRVHDEGDYAPDLTLRLAAYDAADATPSLQDSIELEIPASRISRIAHRLDIAPHADDYSPIHHVCWIIDAHGAARGRGGMAYSDVWGMSGTHDWIRTLRRKIGVLGTGSLSYPIELRIEAKTNTDGDENLFCALVACGIHSAGTG